MNTSSSALGAVLVAGIVLLSACGSDTGSVATTSPVATSPAAVEATGAGFNDADVLFAQGMIPHHVQAVEMASMALDPSSEASAEIRAIATAIQSSQGPEIETMTEWLLTWGQPLEVADMEAMDGMDHDGMDHAGMDGMMSDEQVTALGELSGPEFDSQWVSMMIAHHQGAIEQAEAVKASGSDPAAAELADQIIAAQQAEIAEMQALLAG